MFVFFSNMRRGQQNLLESTSKTSDPIQIKQTTSIPHSERKANLLKKNLKPPNQHFASFTSFQLIVVPEDTFVLAVFIWFNVDTLLCLPPH